MLWKKTTGAPVRTGATATDMESYNAGVGFLQAGNVDRAIEMFSPLVSKDHPSATFNLALLYTQGHGQHLMLEQARALFLRAAELGHQQGAMFSALFNQYDNGFQPEMGSGLSTLLNRAGIEQMPGLVIFAVSKDVIKRLDGRGDAIMFAALEEDAIRRYGGVGTSFLEHLRFDRRSAVRAWAEAGGGPFEGGPSQSISSKMQSLSEHFVGNLGMEEKSWIFVRCSVLGAVCQHYDISPQQSLPSIEFYAEIEKPTVSENMWPFTKKQTHSETHPLIKQFQTLMEKPKNLEWFERVASGWNMGLPADVGLDVQEAMNLSYTITSMAGVRSTALIAAAKSGDFSAINEKLQIRSSSINERSVDSSRNFSRIIEWANDHNLPELQAWDATFYKQSGVPRDIRSLSNLRFLLVTEDHGVTEIPTEISKLPLLQGLCITNNRITSIPTEIYQCISLQRLDLEDNHIARVEDGINALKDVYAIDLSGNELVHVTPDIARMPSLTKLDISNQRTSIDMMRSVDTPLSDASLTALHNLTRRIDVRY